LLSKDIEYLETSDIYFLYGTVRTKYRSSLTMVSHTNSTILKQLWFADTDTRYHTCLSKIQTPHNYMCIFFWTICIFDSCKYMYWVV